MLTIVLAVLAAALAWSGIYWGIEGHHWFWAALGALGGFTAVSLPINLWVRKRMEAIFGGIQNFLVSSQDALRRKVGALQMKISNQQKLMEMVEKEQTEGVRKALTMLDEIKPLKIWNILADKQANTLRAQLLYQIKEFEEADKYLDKCFVLDPLIQAMRMARMYKKGQFKELEKAYHKGVGRFKYEKALLIYATYSWALVQQGKIDEAIAVLNEGKEKAESDVLKHNWEHLVNGRVKRFSNAGIGETWFALQLEPMPAVRPQAQMQFGGRPTRGGFR